MWLLEIERLQPQKSQIPDLFFFLTLHHRERFLEFMYFLMHIFKFLCLSCTHIHTHLISWLECLKGISYKRGGGTVQGLQTITGPKVELSFSLPSLVHLRAGRLVMGADM